MLVYTPRYIGSKRPGGFSSKKQQKLFLMSFFLLGKHEIFVFSWESDSFAADRIMLKKQLQQQQRK